MEETALGPAQLIRQGKGSQTMGLTTDPQEARNSAILPNGQQEKYVVLSAEERAKGFIRPVRDSYQHVACGAVTTMDIAIAETYARDPSFYGATFCIACREHYPVAEFVWKGTDEPVGS